MKIETDYGPIEYRMPNIPEAIQLLGEMGLTADDLQNLGASGNEFKFMSKLITAIGKFVTVSLDYNGDKIESYDDLLNYMEFMPVVNDLAAAIMKGFELDSKKKS